MNRRALRRDKRLIQLSKLISEFHLSPDFVLLLKTQDGRMLVEDTAFRKDQAARIVLLHDLFLKFRSLSRGDLLRLYTELEWAFKNPPNMTFDRAISPGLRFQVIPKKYLMQIELAFPGCK